MNIKMTTLVIMVALFSTLYSCKEKVTIPDYPFSEPKSISALRKVVMSDKLNFGNTSIIAVVTSDVKNGNIDKKTLVVQDKNFDAAIVISLNKDNDDYFLLDDQVSIDLKGAKLEMVDGELRVTNMPNEQITKTGVKFPIQAKSTNIATILKNAPYWGPVLVRLEKITIKNQGAQKLAGNLTLDDEIIEASSKVLPSASFNAEDNPGFVYAFSGIIRQVDKDVFINLRNLEDLEVGLSLIIEDFEQATSTNYDKKELTFATGTWIIDGGITASTGADPKNGKQSIRLQGSIGNDKRNGIVEMTFDFVGVKSISVSHGIYPAGAETSNVNPTVFSVQMSKDQGQTFVEIGTAEIDTDSRTLTESTFPVNVGFSQKVRFRIVNISTPFSNNNRPRINIDDFKFNF
ncbi:MAG: DUF5689 domain-containing protein [Ginsengibacter sp.]